VSNAHSSFPEDGKGAGKLLLQVAILDSSRRPGSHDPGRRELEGEKREGSRRESCHLISGNKISMFVWPVPSLSRPDHLRWPHSHIPSSSSLSHWTVATILQLGKDGVEAAVFLVNVSNLSDPARQEMSKVPTLVGHLKSLPRIILKGILWPKCHEPRKPNPKDREGPKARQEAGQQW
jgi:hypothetical protein